MDKIKLNDKQRYDLLTFCHERIMSQGKHPYHFLSPLASFDVKFVLGAISRAGARVEIIYTFDYCKVKLLLLYTKVNLFSEVYDYVFIPKAITIDRDFRCSFLMAVVRDPETSYCSPIYYYQSIKSITQLCEEDLEDGDAEDEHAGVCLAEVDADSTTLKNENVTL